MFVCVSVLYFHAAISDIVRLHFSSIVVGDIISLVSIDILSCHTYVYVTCTHTHGLDKRNKHTTSNISYIFLVSIPTCLETPTR